MWQGGLLRRHRVSGNGTGIRRDQKHDDVCRQEVEHLRGGECIYLCMQTQDADAPREDIAGPQGRG